MIGRFPPLIYVAGAYKGDVASNIIKAEAVSIALIRNGWHVFTPHKNTAGYEQYEDDLLNKSTWIEMDLNTLDRCDALYIMDNWRISSGTQGEIAFAQKRDIPIFWEEIMPAEELTLQETRGHLLRASMEVERAMAEREAEYIPEIKVSEIKVSAAITMEYGQDLDPYEVIG